MQIKEYHNIKLWRTSRPFVDVCTLVFIWHPYHRCQFSSELRHIKIVKCVFAEVSFRVRLLFNTRSNLSIFASDI